MYEITVVFRIPDEMVLNLHGIQKLDHLPTGYVQNILKPYKSIIRMHSVISSVLFPFLHKMCPIIPQISYRGRLLLGSI